ncbi:CHAT domain-containing protein [Streptomyces sp. NPDC048417]|uniref:CHAT domain-containing protein n=1 Tax=Streptomyces sp. NPDC048417 TaxID=3155387 RepID=UPI003430FCF7
MAIIRAIEQGKPVVKSQILGGRLASALPNPSQRAKLFVAAPVAPSVTEAPRSDECGQGGILYFARHDTFTAAGSKESMADGSFAPIDLAVAAQRRSLRADRPLVFFNACSSSGEIGWFGATLGWAPEFLQAGAAASIGTLWPVRSQTALQFADTFYDQLITHRKPLGHASLTARKAIHVQDGDPTWLAYAIHGNPAVTAHTQA